MSMEASGDWDLRGKNIDQRYARWGVEALTDEEMIALGKAKLVTPRASVGDKLYITSRSNCDCYAVNLRDWGLMVADAISKARYRHPGGERYRAYCEGYDPEWGRQAVLDGLCIAMWGPANVPGLGQRGDQFKVSPKSYQRIRDFVGGVAVEAIAEFRFALLWAEGRVRDRELDNRYLEAIGA